MNCRRLLILPLLGLAGCVSGKENEPLVSPSPFSGPAPIVSRSLATFPQANVEVASRVDLLGRKILAVNQQVGLRPMFCAIGSENPEIFHQGGSKIVVTEGLVKQCRSEPELAALLCRELGKMVSERDALAPQPNMDRLPPVQPRIGSEVVGPAMGTSDHTYEAELALRERNLRRPPTCLPPDPMVLARFYMKKAGFAEAALDEATPLFNAADKNSTWEKQMNTQPARPFTN